MDTLDLTGLLAFGFAAGMAGGLMGVGGGVLFVPALVLFAEESQLGAEATSLVAIVIVSLVGTWRQRGYGNVRLREGIAIGLLSPLGVLAGVALANAVSERALELSFAAVHLEIGGPLFRELGSFLTLREIEVYGSISDVARSMLEQKLEMLGGQTLTVVERFDGFSRTERA